MVNDSQNSEPVCKYCQSTDVLKYGSFKGSQIYYCKHCKRKFNADNHLFKMRTPAEYVSSALDDYYRGMSINDICEDLEPKVGSKLSSKTVYEWVNKYTKEAINQFKDYHPQVGDKWEADETVIHKNFGGKKKLLWLIDIIDSDTRFLLATKLSYNRNRNDIRIAMEQAKERAGKIPKEILTDGWKGYVDGIELAFGADAKHIQTTPFGDKNDSTNIIERMQGTLKERTKVMRGLKSFESAKFYMDGFQVYYNYFRPHDSLNGKTPAESAKVDYPIKNWIDVTRNAKPQVKVLVTPAKVEVIKQALHERLANANKTAGMPLVKMSSRTSRITTPKAPYWVTPHRAKRGSGLTRRSDR